MIKHSRTHEEFERELFVYQQTFPFIPKLLSSDALGLLEIDLIKGVHIGEMERPDFHRIGEMLSHLHQSTVDHKKVVCHIDNNPRNYLFDEDADQYYMIDFADSRMDSPEWDITGFLLFWASMKRQGRFLEIRDDFISGYKAKDLLDPERLLSILKQNIQIFDERRLKYNRHEPILNPDVQRNRREIAQLLT